MSDTTVSTPTKLGFVGLGNMGGPMCRRLVAAGYLVTAFDLDTEALRRAVEAGATAGASAVDCAADADFFLTSLPRPPHVEAVAAGPDGAVSALQPGSVWIDLTTNSASLVAEIAASAPNGVAVVDSPVTGAVDGARNGTLTLFIGGEPGPVERATAVLSHLGTVIPCGPLGTGNVVKLVTNQLWFIAAAAIGEGFAVGLANGVELGTLWEAIKQSVGDSFVVRHDAPSIFAGHYDPSFTLDLCLKDLGLLEQLAEQVDTSLPMTASAHTVFETAAERYGAGQGELHVAKLIEDDAGLSMRLNGDWIPHWEK